MAKSSVTCVNVTGGTQQSCASNPTEIVPNVITGVIAKIPVTLAEFSVQVNLDSIITLPEPALEIKDIKKKVKVTQCLLLQPTNVLFIKGFIRKNIDYATLGCANTEGACGDIRHCTVDVPFKCTTTVNFNGAQPLDLFFNSSNEFGFFRKQPLKGPGFADKDQLLSSDFSEFNQVTQEFFNELPFCELINARVVEYDEYLNRTRPKGVTLPFEEKLFRQVEEKAVVFITLKILQNQQVEIPPCDPTTVFDCFDFECNSFKCFEDFDCGAEFDCDQFFDCSAPFDCPEPFVCDETFLCDDPFACETAQFACGSGEFSCTSAPFDCTDPFDCGTGQFKCQEFDCEDPFKCDQTVFDCFQQTFGCSSVFSE